MNINGDYQKIKCPICSSETMMYIAKGKTCHCNNKSCMSIFIPVFNNENLVDFQPTSDKYIWNNGVAKSLFGIDWDKVPKNEILSIDWKTDNDLYRIMNNPLYKYSQTHNPIYAGFGLRLLAYLLDVLIIGLPFAFILGFILMKVEHPKGTSDIISLIVSWLYFAVSESGEHQGTLGKIIVGIKVTDLNGEKINFGKASGRFFGKIISGIILFIGYIMAGFTEKRQALHDIMSKTLVVKKNK